MGNNLSYSRRVLKEFNTKSNIKEVETSVPPEIMGETKVFTSYEAAISVDY